RVHGRSYLSRAPEARSLGLDLDGDRKLLAVPHGEECLDHRRIELRTGAALELRERIRVRPSRTVRPERRHRVERVGDREKPRLDRDRLAAQATGVAAAVPLLVMEE